MYVNKGRERRGWILIRSNRLDFDPHSPQDSCFVTGILQVEVNVELLRVEAEGGTRRDIGETELLSGEVKSQGGRREKIEPNALS